jgi:2-oxoglutarate ferredoxin oxidoreductase subunit alpha
MDDLNVVIVGSAGEGIQTIGEVLAQAAMAQGYAVFTWQEYESRIRGGQNRYAIRISEAIVNSPLSEADILLALNEKAVEKYLHLKKNAGILMAPHLTSNENSIAIAFTDISKKSFGNPIYGNTIAAGALSAALGIDRQALKEVLKNRFSIKGEPVVENNLRAADLGYEHASLACQDICPWQLTRLNHRYYHITGNEAIPLAAVYAGCRFISAYPMTPSTGIITRLARDDRLGVFAEQAEDEIAAINMAIGAGFAGARAMTATAGGGFALMVESVSLAGMIEVPVVIIVGQRPGPATGLPTRTSQADLLFVIHAGHGEFPKIVMAPSDAKDAFQKTIRAFNLADQFQIPVILLTDQFLADSGYSFSDMGTGKILPEYFLAAPSEVEAYKRYKITENGISPRLYPGQSEHLVAADSDEHDEQGHITEDLDNTVPAMVNKRVEKLRAIKGVMDPPDAYKLDDAEVVFVGWGSTRGAICEGINLLALDDIRAGSIHFNEVWPLPIYEFPSGKAYWSVEGNTTNQFARLLKSEYSMDFDGHISRADGLPITGEYLRRAFHDQQK